MQRQITPDQCYCSFGDGIVYEFVPTDCVPHLNDCFLCAFWPDVLRSNYRIKCLSAPCQKGLRKDKKSGFWSISESVNYQQFIKILKKSLNI